MRISAPAHPSATGIGRISGLVFSFSSLPRILPRFSLTIPKANVFARYFLLKWGVTVTRPDIRPIPVADGWAEAEMRVFALSHLGPTDRPTDKASYRIANPRLKILKSEKTRSLARLTKFQTAFHKTSLPL